MNIGASINVLDEFITYTLISVSVTISSSNEIYGSGFTYN